SNAWPARSATCPCISARTRTRLTKRSSRRWTSPANSASSTSTSRPLRRLMPERSPPAGAPRRGGARRVVAERLRTERDRCAPVNDDAAAVYRRLLRYVHPHRYIVAGAVIAAVFYAGGTGVLPLLLGDVVSQFSTEALVQEIEEGGRFTEAPWMIAVAIAVVFGIRGIMDFLIVYGLGWVGRSVVRDLRTELFEHYLAMPTSDIDQASSGDLISKLTYNTEQVAEAISNAIVVLIRDSLTIVVLVGIMIWLSPPLTLLVAVVGPTIGALVGYMSKAFRRHSSRIQSSMGDVTRVAEQSLQGHRIIKVFQGQDYEREQFESINGRNFRLNILLTATRAAGDSLTQYVVALGAAAVFFVALSDWVRPTLDAEMFVEFLAYMAMLLAPLKRLVNINVSLQRGIAAAQSLFETIDGPVERDTGTETLERARGDV